MLLCLCLSCFELQIETRHCGIIGINFVNSIIELKKFIPMIPQYLTYNNSLSSEMRSIELKVQQLHIRPGRRSGAYDAPQDRLVGLGWGYPLRSRRSISASSPPWKSVPNFYHRFMVTLPQYYADFKKYSFIFRMRNKGIESHDNDIDLLRISETMFAKRLFIHRMPSVLCN